MLLYPVIHLHRHFCTFCHRADFLTENAVIERTDAVVDLQFGKLSGQCVFGGVPLYFSCTGFHPQKRCGLAYGIFQQRLQQEEGFIAYGQCTEKPDNIIVRFSSRLGAGICQEQLSSFVKRQDLQAETGRFFKQISSESAFTESFPIQKSLPQLAENSFCFFACLCSIT